ncbi:MAG: respiratory nitrate reductase subunit gamma [bacterium]|nr:respiratory nitrate reductase subunit gamma [bacterium]
MFDAFLFAGLPYAAVLICIVGVIYRFRKLPFGITPRSTQFLEHGKLRWAAAPWHIAIIPILIAHILAFVFPALWQTLLASQVLLVTLEMVGIALGVTACIGIAIMLTRKVIAGRLQAITGFKTITVLSLLFVQVLLGVLTAINHRWGGLWYSSTLAPYLWSMIKLQPDLGYVTALPFIVKMHIVGGFLIILLIPFTRLIHMFAVPYEYLYRLPQRVVWARPQSLAMNSNAVRMIDARRSFIKSAVAMGVGGTLLSFGVADKMVRFFGKPEIEPEEETALLATRLKRLKMTAEEKELELERRSKDYILIARLSELNDKKGKYFIDYEMHPALAFMFADGFPLLISAKCTHLGCTVGSELDANGKILCPCHVSYFDVKTGEPNPGAPAKARLPHLGWVIKDNDNNIVAHQKPGSSPEGSFDRKRADQYRLFIARQYQPESV